MNLYTPVRFYRPAFYSYAYSPWVRPVAYSWGWGGSPWYGYYGGYFSPYREYAGPAFWLTDYLFAMTLQQAYQDRIDAGLQGGGYAGGGQVGLTPDVKQAVADEVHRQLDLERIEGQSMASASGDMSPIFSDNIPHVFVVSNSLMVDDRGPGCPVSEGDVLQLRPGSSNGAAADVVVLASKVGDCRRGGVVSVQLQDLQEMQNHMRETIDQGLAELQSRQGKGGLPPLPAAAAGAAGGFTHRRRRKAGRECCHRTQPGGAGSRQGGAGRGQPERGKPILGMRRGRSQSPWDNRLPTWNR